MYWNSEGMIGMGGPAWARAKARAGGLMKAWQEKWAGSPPSGGEIRALDFPVLV